MEGKLIILTGEGLGQGKDELGHVLLANFLRTLANRSDKPSAIVLMHDGVRLACRGTLAFEAQEHLRELARQTAVFSCRTCLETYNLVEQLEVGQIGGMVQFVEMMASHEVLCF